MRELLVHTQVRNVDECANGSWPPEKDIWGRRGGRIMQTSLSALTLEIYYRYSPLYSSQDGNGKGASLAAAGTADTLVPARDAVEKAAKSAKKLPAKKTKSE